jgi:hypothetical protein
MGGGAYGQDNEGSYFWAKSRFRPFEMLLNSKKIGIGAFGFGAFGSGHDEDFNYRWEKFAFGPSVQTVGRHWDTDLDVGIGRLYNNGNVSEYESKQEDDIFLLSAHGNFYSRRDRGEKWLPKTELNFELTLPYRSVQQHSWGGEPLAPNPYDNRVAEVNLKQGLYDFDVESHNSRITPGFNLGLVREWGPDSDFFQFGPEITVSYSSFDVFQLSFLNYKKALGDANDQWQWFAVWVDVSGLVKSINKTKN